MHYTEATRPNWRKAWYARPNGTPVKARVAYNMSRYLGSTVNYWVQITSKSDQDFGKKFFAPESWITDRD